MTHTKRESAGASRIREGTAKKPRRAKGAPAGRTGDIEPLVRQWSSLFQHLYDAVIVTDLDGRIVEWNPAASALYGYTRGEALGKKAEELNPPAERRAVSRSILRGLDNAGIWVGEIRVVRKDGSEGRAESVIVPVRDEKGRRVAVLSFDRDITERTRAAEELGIFRELINRSGENLSIIDLQTGRFLYVNDTCCASTGYSRDEFAAMRVADIDPSVKEPWSAKKERAHRTDRITRLREGLIRRRDGTIFPVEVSSSIVRVAGKEYLIATARDITDRQRGEDERSRQRDFLRKVIDVIPELVFVKDAKDRYILANRGLADAYAMTPEQMVGKSDVELGNDPAEAAGFREADREVLRTGREMIVSEETFTLASGETRYYQTTRRPLADEEGGLTRILAVSVDITERRLMQARLIQSQKMETVGRLAGGIAHDFNNLLSIILNCAYFLSKDLPPDSPLREDTAQILATTERCVDLIRKLLAFSRRQIISPRAVGVGEILRSAEKMLRRLIQENISLEIVSEPGAGMVRADPAQIEHALINLCINARDAMPGGGAITIRAARAIPPDGTGATADGEARGKWVMISVRDTGAGMSDEVKSHIFEPYYTTKEMGRGTGLGLSSIYGIVIQHGGHIRVQSAPGKGTEFRIYLPRLRREREPLRGGSASAPPSCGSETVLLVEDQRSVREVTARMLRSLGYTVRDAGSGDEALALVTRGGAEGLRLLITDVIMPGMGGRELAAVLARKIPGLKVLFISGYPEEEIGHCGLIEPGIYFLPKPFDQATIGKKMRELLDRRGGA